MPGRPPKPTAVKALQGTLQKVRVRKDEPKPRGQLVPSAPPKGLTKGAQALWRYALECAPEALLTALDAAVFEQWCSQYDLACRLRDRINKDGEVVEDKDGNHIVNPLLHGYVKLMQQLRALQNDLGFTPASRTKISTGKPDAPKNEFIDL